MLPRRDAFPRYPGLAAHCGQYQTALLNSVDAYEPGEAVYLELDDDEPTVLDAAMAATLTQNEAEEIEALCDAPNDREHTPTPSGMAHTQIILEPEASDFAELAHTAGDRLARLCTLLDCASLAIMPVVRAPILGQVNDYPEAKDARSRLIALGFDPVSDDAIEGSPKEIAPAIGALFWIARCNASAPEIVLGFRGSNMAFSFCKYGNFHVHLFHVRLAEEIDIHRFERSAGRIGMSQPLAGYCQPRFSGHGSIAGRQIQV